MQKNKGFTLLEILVVIAIVGVLASIVLVLLGNAKNKSLDNKVKAVLNQARTQASIFYTTGGTYSGVCTSTNDTANPKGIYGMVLSAAQVVGISSVTVNGTGSTTTATCNTNGTTFAAEVPITGTGNLWCVDGTQKGKVETTSIGAGVACL